LNVTLYFFINHSYCYRIITIANSDSTPAADAVEAMRMGHRAVTEIKVCLRIGEKAL
jgi:hypothetical protein